MVQENRQGLVVVRLTPHATSLERRGSVVVGVRDATLRHSIMATLQALNIQAFECQGPEARCSLKEGRTDVCPIAAGADVVIGHPDLACLTGKVGTRII